MLFAPGSRPSSGDIVRLASADGAFTVTGAGEVGQEFQRGSSSRDQLSPGRDWVEVLANGLAFDLAGLSSGPACPDPAQAYSYGFVTPPAEGVEAITMQPGPHLSGGGAMPPVVRCLAWLGAKLAELPGAQAVAWHPARSWSSPDYYRRSIIRWIEGGVFPGLGLTALAPVDGGGMRSEGLRLFIGRELQVDAGVASNEADLAKISLRLLHWLVESGGLDEPVSLTGPSGESLEMTCLPGGDYIGVRRTG